MKLKVMYIIIIVCILICGIIGYGLYERNVFTVEKWNRDIYQRKILLDDLTKKYNINAMTYEEVVELLGVNGIVPNSRIQYFAGKSYAGPVLFSISFDENDRVKSYGIIID